jgi:hypothetical protein
VDHQLKLLKDAGLPTPQNLLGKNIKLEIGTGEVWTTIISISTIANDDGYPELGVASALLRGDTVVSVQVREGGKFYCRYKYRSNRGGQQSDTHPCKIALL